MFKKEKAHIEELIKGFEQVCRIKGLRITHQRLEIFRELASYPGHPTAENIYNQVRRRLKTISLDTVYRTIMTFEKYDLIKRIQILDVAARFDINLSVHHHLVCTRCKKVEDFYWPEFDKLTPPKADDNWSEIFSKHVEVRGLCANCKSKRKLKVN